MTRRFVTSSAPNVVSVLATLGTLKSPPPPPHIQNERSQHQTLHSQRTAHSQTRASLRTLLTTYRITLPAKTGSSKRRVYVNYPKPQDLWLVAQSVLHCSFFYRHQRNIMPTTRSGRKVPSTNGGHGDTHAFTEPQQGSIHPLWH